MKKNNALSELLLLMILFILGIITGYNIKNHNHVKAQPANKISDTIYYLPTKSDTIEVMANAFSYVESRNTDNAISSDGKYVGCLQISKIYVKEANRILKDSIFSYNDRYDKIMSYAIFEVLQLEHNPTLDIDKAITVWNKDCSRKYRNEVKVKYYEYLKYL